MYLMDFEPCFKVYNFVSVYSKSIKLGHRRYSVRDLSCSGVNLSIG